MMLSILAGLAVFGLMVGSFLNVCIGRIPAGESIVSPGSRCPSCRKPIAWYDNVPVLSYLLLGGRCRACKARISLRYPIVEIVTAVAFVLQGLALGEAAQDQLPLLGARLLFTALLITLFCTDLDTMRLPDVLTIPGIGAGLVLSVWLPPGIVASLIGAALGAAIPYAIRWLWFRMKGVEAMGLGDVKMLAMIGAFLGWQQVLVVLFLSSLTGAVIGVTLAALKGRTLASRLPFGTFLALGAYAASLWGGPIVDWYIALYK
jgi:leader peptidase (prepilin peptidase)/N-methyltransferase